MASERESGVTVEPGAAPWRKRAWLAVALGIVAASAWVELAPLQESPPPAPHAQRVEPSDPASPQEHADPIAAASARPAGAMPSPPAAGEDRGSPQQLARDAAPPGSIPSGIGLFPPPGTDPVKIGIVVPEDFPLPEGYLRHYQVTDDGQSMPAILMFHPDFELLDARGEAIPLPADRVVPAEHAPPGLEVELLVPPPPRQEEGGL